MREEDKELLNTIEDIGDISQTAIDSLRAIAKQMGKVSHQFVDSFAETFFANEVKVIVKTKRYKVIKYDEPVDDIIAYEMIDDRWQVTDMENIPEEYRKDISKVAL